MLVITRKVGESIVIDDLITVRVLSCKGKSIRLAIEAPREVHIAREELLTKDEHLLHERNDRRPSKMALAII